MDPSATYRSCLLCPRCQDPLLVVVVHHLVPPVDIPRLDKARAPIDCGLLLRLRRPRQRLQQSFVQMMCTPLARAGGGRVCDCYRPTGEYVRFFLFPFSSLALKPRRPMLDDGCRGSRIAPSSFAVTLNTRGEGRGGMLPPPPPPRARCRVLHCPLINRA